MAKICMIPVCGIQYGAAPMVSVQIQAPLWGNMPPRLPTYEPPAE